MDPGNRPASHSTSIADASRIVGPEAFEASFSFCSSASTATTNEGSRTTLAGERIADPPPANKSSRAPALRRLATRSGNADKTEIRSASSVSLAADGGAGASLWADTILCNWRWLRRTAWTALASTQERKPDPNQSGHSPLPETCRAIQEGRMVLRHVFEPSTEVRPDGSARPVGYPVPTEALPTACWIPQYRFSPSMMRRASLGCTGSCSMRLPKSEIRPSSVMAPSLANNTSAASMADTAGGSNQANEAISRIPAP